MVDARSVKGGEGRKGEERHGGVGKRRRSRSVHTAQSLFFNDSKLVRC